MDKIQQELNNLKQLREKLIQETKNVKKKNFCCRNIRGNMAYYINNKYVSKRKHADEISSLSKLEYNNKLLVQLDTAIGILEKAIEIPNNLENVFFKLHDGKKRLIEPEIKPVSLLIEEFEKEDFQPKEFEEDNSSCFYTIKGERVRSKSEKIIADELYRLNIPYHYEQPLELYNNKKKVTIYPDLTVLNIRNGNKFYWEHLGMLDNMSYYEATLNRFNLYEKNNIFIGEDVIITHESRFSPLDTSTLINKIENYLM